MLLPLMISALISAPSSQVFNGTWDGYLETDHERTTCPSDFCDGTAKHSWGFDAGRMVYGEGHVDLHAVKPGIFSAHTVSKAPSESGTTQMLTSYLFAIDRGKLLAILIIEASLLDENNKTTFSCVCASGGRFIHR